MFIILVYCLVRNEIAYSSSDKLIYIRQFLPNGFEMKLKSILQGHDAEVTQVFKAILVIISYFEYSSPILCVYSYFYYVLRLPSLFSWPALLNYK